MPSWTVGRPEVSAINIHVENTEVGEQAKDIPTGGGGGGREPWRTGILYNNS